MPAHPTSSLSWDGEDAGELRDPTADELARSIRRLDGGRRTIVTLQCEAGRIVVGGSAADGLAVYADLDDGAFWSAVSPAGTASGTVVVVAGGQPGEHQARLVVPSDVAVLVASELLGSGTLSTRIGWEKS